MAGPRPNQLRTLLSLLDSLGPELSRDRNFPERMRRALADRRFGSQDRRLYRELGYTAFRYWGWWTLLRAERPEAEALAALVWLAADRPFLRPWAEALLAGWPGRASTLAEQATQLRLPEDRLFPAWFAAEAPDAQPPAQRFALLQRAPLWVRVQDEADQVHASLAEKGWLEEASPRWPGALRLKAEVDLLRDPLYEQGWVEIQDLGSQRILAENPALPGEHWLDACAGAGGKTLQLAQQVGALGRVTAYEPRASARAELLRRTARLRRTKVELRETPPPATERFDGVLVDAPCSGSGTWRRAPHLKASTTVAELRAAAERQKEILRRYAGHVRPGGRLIYATCSLARCENEGVLADFLAASPEFRAEGPPLGTSLRPADHDGDGFYVATLRRTA